MGHLVYGQDAAIPVDDRVLTHLQIVIIDKLRRKESFAFEIVDDSGRRRDLFITPFTPLQFVYSGNRSPSVNHRWLELLAMSAASTEGLRVVPEPPQAPDPHR